jgi:hypothetical protein
MVQIRSWCPTNRYTTTVTGSAINGKDFMWARLTRDRWIQIHGTDQSDPRVILPSNLHRPKGDQRQTAIFPNTARTPDTTCQSRMPSRRRGAHQPRPRFTNHCFPVLRDATDSTNPTEDLPERETTHRRVSTADSGPRRRHDLGDEFSAPQSISTRGTPTATNPRLDPCVSGTGTMPGKLPTVCGGGAAELPLRRRIPEIRSTIPPRRNRDEHPCALDSLPGRSPRAGRRW